MKLKLFGLTLLSLIINGSSIIKGISHYGLETEGFNYVCNWVHPIEFYVDKYKELGFNYIRVPFSYDYIKRGDFSQLDRLFNAVRNKPINIMLDYHRTRSSHQSYKPDAEVSLDDFKRGWIDIIQRYVNEPSFKMIDIFNEYQGSDIGYWNWITKDIVNHIEYNFPNRFIFSVSALNWGGNLQGVSLEDLPFNDRIQYTIHRYHFSGGDWNSAFGSMPPHKINIGEFGWKTSQQNEKQWAYDFLGFLKSKGIKDTFLWTTAHSHDTDGLFYDDCHNIDWDKFNILKNYWKDSEEQPYQEL